MEKLFYKKWTSILIIAAILLVVVLLCMLFTQLAQKSSFDQRIKKLNSLIDQAQQDIDSQKKIIEYKETDQYIIDWAIKHGYVSGNDYLFVPVE